MEPESLQHDFDSAFAGIRQVREGFTPRLTPREVGSVTNVSTGIATLSGLPGAGYDGGEIPGDCWASRSTWMRTIGVILLGEYQDLHAGDEVGRTGRVIDIAVGDGLFGG